MQKVQVHLCKFPRSMCHVAAEAVCDVDVGTVASGKPDHGCLQGKHAEVSLPEAQIENEANKHQDVRQVRLVRVKEAKSDGLGKMPLIS